MQMNCFTDCWKNIAYDLDDILLWKRSILATYAIDWNPCDGHSNMLHHNQSPSHWTKVQRSVGHVQLLVWVGEHLLS